MKKASGIRGLQRAASSVHGTGSYVIAVSRLLAMASCMKVANRSILLFRACDT